jgi:glycosyltransferase involved in cell wall biosynthesis
MKDISTKFSVIVPVYNADKTLSACLNSCINQSYSNIEIICIDDCSTDNSREILTSFQNTDKRIKCIFHSKNEGQHTARLSGIAQISGNYVLFLDSDDSFRLDAFKLIASRIGKCHADIIQFGYTEIPNRKIIYKPFFPSSKERISQYLAKENRLSPLVWICAYKYSVVQNAYKIMENFYAPRAEDLYESIIFSNCAESYSFIKKPLVNYSLFTGGGRKIQSLQTYKSWLLSYYTVIQKTTAFVSQYIPEYADKCCDMELTLLYDFLTERLRPEISSEIKYHIFDMLPEYFSKNILYALAENLLNKSIKYDKHLNFNVSFRSKTFRLLKIFLLYIKSLFKK